MAGSTQIGSASVVLSANADGLATGFAAAEKRVQAFGAGVGKKLEASASAGGSGAGGGLMARLLGGAGSAAAFAGIGAAAGVAAAAGGRLFDAVAGIPAALAGIPAKMRELAQVADGPTAGGLSAVATSAGRIGVVFEQAAGKVLSKLAPAFVLAESLASRLFERAGPLLDKVGDALAAVGAVVVEGFGAAADAVLGVVDQVAAWGANVVGVADTTEVGSQAMFRALRQVGTAAADLWEGMRAGAGIVANTSAAIVDGFGGVVDSLAEALELLIQLNEWKPGLLKSAGFDLGFDMGDFRGFIEDVRGFGEDAKGVAADLRDLGAAAVLGVGDAERKVAGWFDAVEAKFKKAKAGVANQSVPRQLAGAFAQDSVQAYSLVAQYKSGAEVNDLQKRQLVKLEDVRREVAAVGKAVAGAVEAIPKLVLSVF